MSRSVEALEARINKVRTAFAQDGFLVADDDIVCFRDRIGIRALHRTASSYDTGAPKVAYYVEGTAFEMGFLMGRLAESEIDRMTETFIDRVFGAMIREAVRGERLDFTGTHGPRIIRIHGLLVGLVRDMIRARGVLSDVPRRIHQEIRGILAGSREAARLENRSTSVTEEELWVLNAGLDCILSRTHTGILLPAFIRPRDLRLPIACNGFAILNDAAADGALFARDYMFPTGGIFQEVACHVIYNPVSDDDEPRLPFVSMTAPGIIGSISAMNTAGVAAGVDVAVGGNCDPRRPGFNSLLLVRDCIEHGHRADGALQRILSARRGVTWNYILADGGGDTDRACVVEAGASVPHIAFAGYPVESQRPLLPNREFLDQHPSAEQVRGAMTRWDDFRLPAEYLEFNPPLWARFQKLMPIDGLAARGRINSTPTDRNLPGAFYFAPLRGRPGQVILTTNHFVIPEMRLCSMHPWASRVAKPRLNDSQWRYDELNHRILATLDRKEPIDEASAKRLLSFLAPDGDFPDYYRLNPKSRDGEQTLILGSSSLFNLKARTVESHYGYFADPWIKIHLTDYVGDPLFPPDASTAPQE